MRTLCLFLALLCLAAPAHAARDIVYAARYYAPRHSRLTTYSHLYRINPDGTGRQQITFGTADDTYPAWSPDGHKIAFLREDSRYQTTLCVISENGGVVKTLLRYGDSDYGGYHWSRDSRSVRITYHHEDKTGNIASLYTRDIQGGGRYETPGVTAYAESPDGSLFCSGSVAGIGLHKDGQVFRIAPPVISPLWLDDATLLGIREGDTDTSPPVVRELDAAGHQKRQIALTLPPHSEYDLAGNGTPYLLSVPGDTRHFVYALNSRDSTTGIDYAFFLTNRATGKMTFLTEGQTLAWSPDGRHFCAMPGRDTIPYSKSKNGRTRTVWGAALQVGSVGGKTRTITPGLIWVQGADWRGGGNP